MTRPIFVAVAAITLAAPALAQDLEACDRYPDGAASYACMCEAQTTPGSIWGTGTYTSDSDICTAALHAGVITALGGPVLAVARDGQAEYPASSANGIESRSWGSYGSSFSFDPKGPRFTTVGAASACGRFDEGLERLRCACAPGVPGGAVWGSGPYTADSDLCAAAMHAGVMTERGGEITVLRFPGLDQYVGSERNGITTRDWGSYGTSVIINANE